MSAKTKIVVLHMKEVIYTGIFVALGILLVVLLVTLFLPGSKGTSAAQDTPTDEAKPPKASNGASPASASAAEGIYLPGIYTTQLVLGGETVDVEVILEADSISSIRLVNLSESVTTMYPLLEPTFASVCKQVCETQSVDNITYSADNKYTSLVLAEAIRNSLEKASVSSEE